MDNCGRAFVPRSSIMDLVEFPSSSNSPLPPSSGQIATYNPTNTIGSSHARTVDPLALDDDEPRPSNDREEENASTSRRSTRARNQRMGNIPVVKDATGEKVLESFEIFLKTLVPAVFYA